LSATATSAAVRARTELELELEAAGIEATGDSGAFFPQPVGVLIGLPTLVGRTLAARTFTIPVTVVSGDPLNSNERVAALYELADEVAGVLSTAAYRPTQFRSSANAEPLPALEVVVTVTVSEEG
jgi:hypothetical protein